MNLIEPFVEPGADIGPYHVLEELGTGGSGQVLKVEDTRNGELRAVKVRFRRGARERQPSLNLRRELRAMARCDHPNIARAYEIGVTETHAYLVMEYVPGCPIDEYLYRTGLPPGLRRDRLVAFLGMQIAGALEHIHGRHLIHRDLKPGNILVTGNEVVKIVDFGIARDVARGESVDPGDLAGTYAYCSPEQVSEMPLDHRSDLYSLGVVLYEMLTDHLPFVADSPFSFVVKHITTAPDPIETYYQAVSAAFRDLVLQLLEKKPNDRPRSALEVERFLKDFVERFDQDRRGPRVALYGTPSVAPGPGRVLEPEFIDRKLELLRIEGAVSLLEAGAGGAVLVAGDAGSGKSRLVDEALADARRRGIAVFGTRCLPQADRPFQCLLDIVASMTEALPGDSLSLVQTMLGDHLHLLARAVPQVARLLPDGAATRRPGGHDPVSSRPVRAGAGDTPGAGWREAPPAVAGERDQDDSGADLEELSDESVQVLDPEVFGEPGSDGLGGESILPAASRLASRSGALPVAVSDALRSTVDDEARLRDALQAFLTLVPATPAVLAIKDLQWADATLLSLLSDLVSSPPAPLSAPVIWIGTVSTDELDGQPIESWLTSPPALVERLRIRPLGPQHVLEMVRSMLGRTTGLEDLAETLFRLSRGNPLFVYEMVHELVEAGGLRFSPGNGGGDVWELAEDDAGARAVLQAGSLEQLMADRIARLPTAAADLVEWLAVLGRPCPLEWLVQVSGLSEDALLDQVETLVARRIVTERVGRTRTTLSFYQPSYVELIRSRIAPERMPQILVKAAEAWLEQAGPAGDATDLAAELLYRAGDYARAVDFLLRGSDRASQLGLRHLAYRRSAEAVGCCAQAPDIDPRLDVLANLSMGRTLERLGNLEVSLAYLQDAYNKAARVGAPGIAGQALAAIGHVHARGGILRRAARILEKAIERLADAGEDRLLLPSLDELGALRVTLGDIDGAHACFDRLLELADTRRGGAERRARAHRGRAAIALFEGRLDMARRWLESAERYCSEWKDSRYGLLCRLDLAWTRYLSGELALGRVQLERTQEDLERAGLLEASLLGLSRLAAVALELNDTVRAAHLLERLGTALAANPQRLLEAWCAWTRGLLAVVSGDIGKAGGDIERGRAIAAAEGFTELGVLVDALGGVVKARGGDPEGGVALLTEAVATGERHRCAIATATAKLWLAETAFQAGKPELAHTSLDAAQEEAERFGLPLILLRVCVLRGRKALDAGETRDADALLEMARARYRELVRGMTLDERRQFDRRPDIAILLET